MKILLPVGFVVFVLLSACGESPEPKPEPEYEEKSSVLEYRESQSGQNTHIYFDTVRRSFNQNNPTESISRLLNEIGSPLSLSSSEPIRKGSQSSTWLDNQGGEIIVYDESCSSPTGKCIKRLSFIPSQKTKIMNIAKNRPNWQFISSDNWSGNWPFTVEYGALVCDRGDAVYFIEGSTGPSRTRYPLNGLAKSANRSNGDLKKIWRDHPDQYLDKYSIGPAISKGLALCR